MDEVRSTESWVHYQHTAKSRQLKPIRTPLNRKDFRETGTRTENAVLHQRQILACPAGGSSPAALLLGALLMTAVAALATLLPARRAMRVEPMEALRSE